MGITHNGNTVGSLTKFQKSVIIGSILGDGYLRIIRGRKNAFLEVNHSIKEKDYVDWKYAVLKNIIKTPPKMRKSGNQKVAYRFFTRCHPELTDLLKRFYLKQRKIIPEDIKLNSIVLAVWYMDDGCKCGKDNYYLNTQGFDRQSQYKLIHKLKLIGINSSLNKDKKYFRIRIKSDSIKKFISIIKNILIRSMRYKI